MNLSLQYFLVVAEELSISRAAEKMFVSQQCISIHIKKLEQTYQTELFTRKPTFRLTPEGEALRRSSLRQQVLEDALTKELNELKEQRINRIRVGIHNTRASLLLPSVIQDFHERFPNVLIEIYQGNTIMFESMLSEGKLDLFLGTDTAERPEFRCAFLQKEPLILIASTSLLKAYQMEDVIRSHRISPMQLSKLPFISSPGDSYIQTKIDTWLEKQRIDLQRKIVVGTYQIQLILASQSAGACFCPQMFLQMVADLNLSLSDDAHLIPITVEDFDLSTELSIISHRDAYESSLLREFQIKFEQAIASAFNAGDCHNF